MKKILFKGCGTAIATPFDEKGVNTKEFSRLIENQIQNKVDAIIVCGTTGESSTMTEEEKVTAIKCALDTSNKRVPIIVGTGSNNTNQAVHNSILAEKLGADGLLVVTPYYNKCTQQGLIEHYKKIANSVSLPIILYSVSSRTGVNIEPQTCFELSKIENIVAIKEASGNISQIAELCSQIPPLWFEFVLHQRIPLFYTAYCLYCRHLSHAQHFPHCGMPCEHHHLALRDRVSEEHIILTDQGCRNTIFNSRIQTACKSVEQLIDLGIRKFRLEFTTESASETKEVIYLYRQLLEKKISGEQLWSLLDEKKFALTRGNI